jgi:aspartyl/glutamyl-tRNA(Asn/Gln) amidotransferase C subunit
MLDIQEIKRLQKLANIKLSESEEKKLGTQLENIIQFLGQLGNLPVAAHPEKKSELTLRTLP